MFMFGWDFEVSAQSIFWRWNLIKICVRTFNMNITQGSAVPYFHRVQQLAMIVCGKLMYLYDRGEKPCQNNRCALSLSLKNWKLNGQALSNAPNTKYWIPNDSVYMWTVSVPWLPPIPMTAHSKPAFSVQVNASWCTFLHLVLINSMDLYLIALFVST